MAEKRRLPVLLSPKSSPSDDGDTGEPRPPWHWVGFGVVIIFAAWLPLSYVGGAVQRSMLASKFGQDASPDQIRLAKQHYLQYGGQYARPKSSDVVD